MRNEIVGRRRPDGNIHAARDGRNFVCLNGVSIIVSLLYAKQEEFRGEGGGGGGKK